MQPLAPERSRIGWIGLGRIGAPIAERVRAAGWQVSFWARRPAAAAPMSGPSLTWFDDPRQLAANCDAVVTVVGGPDDVTDLHATMMPAARAGTLFIDHSTALPANAERSNQLAETLQLGALDCPITGGVAGAQRGSLTAFAGGSEAVLGQALPLLHCYCQRVMSCGAAGGGYRTKLINQTLMAGVLMGLADGTRLARARGMDAAWLKSTLASGTGSSTLFDTYWDRMMSGEGAVTFTLGLLLKDLRLARSECATLQLDAPLLDAALAAVDAAVGRHGPQAGVQALAL